jgi:hypothetical protein
MASELNINEIFENAMKDPTLFSKIDIELLLDSIEKDKNDYLENKTMQDVTEDIFNKIDELDISKAEKQKICNKLIGYRFVDEIHEIHKGKHVRWIRNTTQKLTNGGIVMDIKFLDNGTQILCMNSIHRFNQYKFDECFTFQKLSVEEQLILMAYDYMTNSA